MPQEASGALEARGGAARGEPLAAQRGRHSSAARLARKRAAQKPRKLAARRLGSLLRVDGVHASLEGAREGAREGAFPALRY